MKHHVLFVDDEASVTDGIRRALRSAPFATLTANSGKEALEVLASQPVDAVVSDERMPGMSGSELLSRVRETHPDTVRLILSGEADLATAVRAINEGGVYRFLLKPCPPQDLMTSLSEALESLESQRRFRTWQASRDETAQSDPDKVLDRVLEELSVVFQPIVRSFGDVIFAHEALVRTTDPILSNPDLLFGHAEAIGRVADVDAAIRAEIARYLPDLPPRTSLFVNLHPDSLLDDRVFADDDPLVPWAERLVIEITERSSLHESEERVARIDDLRNRGYRIALDDLGAGHAGLNSFALLAPDVVKLDMKLIRGIRMDSVQGRLVGSISAVCRELDIVTVAEGIETPEELHCVRTLGVDLLQGYLLGRPARRFLLDGDLGSTAA